MNIIDTLEKDLYCHFYDPMEVYKTFGNTEVLLRPHIISHNSVYHFFYGLESDMERYFIDRINPHYFSCASPLEEHGFRRKDLHETH